ncbi:hypothetical protein [Streptomyces sp. NPDC007063]|uniref:hypothetical protein n=1 Tax=Streptomyces sp. NPDC007063 TaxID=3364772 RepID=UPI00368782EC
MSSDAPDRRGHGQDTPGDPDGDAFAGPAAVLSEDELPRACVVDRLDELAAAPSKGAWTGDEREDEHFLAFVGLASALICYRRSAR